MTRPKHSYRMRCGCAHCLDIREGHTPDLPPCSVCDYDSVPMVEESDPPVCVKCSEVTP